MPDRDRPLVLVSNRGPSRFQEDGSVKRGHGRPRDRAHRPRLAPRRDLDRVGDDRGRRERSSASTASEPFSIDAPHGGEFRVRFVESDPDAYDGFYNVIANPMLWFIQHYLWDQSNAPDIRRAGGRGVRARLQRRQRGPRAGRARGDRGRRRARRHGPRLPLLHAAGDHPARAPGRLPAPLHPHPVDAAGRLARAAEGHPRPDLRRACSPTTSSASTRAPTGATSCSAAAT